jgi:hypothetical protein
VLYLLREGAHHLGVHEHSYENKFEEIPAFFGV